ncbi:hypothetical protein E2C01_073697 [Portunus trituberculatus]|uniref:Uncharacterized protein n=1 Tax=Portunus trituberculatus TaxID=210409 RepID=A0A5B7IA45_PORTR|nr:hypothetical protein [Portunus trituberculatus]
MGNPRWPPPAPRHYDTTFAAALRVNVSSPRRGSDSSWHINIPKDTSFAAAMLSQPRTASSAPRQAPARSDAATLGK